MNNALQITNLYAQTVEGHKILNGVNLTLKKGEIHALMGPNGHGKSTLAQVLMGHPTYVITDGSIKLNGQDITKLPPDQRAKLGLFLGFQYPVEVAGVNYANFLRLAINEKKGPDDKKVSPLGIRTLLKIQADQLSFQEDITKRSLNEGFSGGEKKKAEIMQLALLKPDFAILDEPDSGLDVDSLKHIAQAINNLDFPLGLLLITHYQRILHFIKPEYVHVMIKGKIAQSGDSTLARKIEEEGYTKYK
jgi:Fe-S cluster assembly ATP-binding protein